MQLVADEYGYIDSKNTPENFYNFRHIRPPLIYAYNTAVATL